MARGRMLNKSVSASLKFHALPDDTCRLLATWIIAHLDKNGVTYGDAGMVRSQVFPLRDDLSNAQIEAYLQAIEAVCDDDDRRMMVRFKAKGRMWQYWPGFDENQVGLRKDREGTTYPLPPGYVPDEAEPIPTDIPENAGELPEGIRQVDGNTPPKAKASKAKAESKQRLKAESKAEGKASKGQILPAAASSADACFADALDALARYGIDEPKAREITGKCGADWVLAWRDEIHRRGDRVHSPASMLIAFARDGTGFPDKPPGNGRDKRRRSIDGEYAEYIQTGTEEDRHGFIGGEYADIIEH